MWLPRTLRAQEGLRTASRTGADTEIVHLPLRVQVPNNHKGGCQNYGPFLEYPKYWVPYYNRDPKRDHNFDNHHPYTYLTPVI